MNAHRSFGDSVDYLYDDAGRLIRVSKPDNTRLLYYYDEVGNLLFISGETSIPQALPPVLQTISPELFLTGAIQYVTIRGQNLLTTSGISTDNPNLTFSKVVAMDTAIHAMLSSGSATVPGQATVTVSTSYGTANITIDLHKANITPAAVSLFTICTAPMTVDLTPAATKDLNVVIRNNNPDIVDAQAASVVIPAGGTAGFTIRAVREGIATISIGNTDATVYVTQVNALDIESAPVAVSIGYVPADTLIHSIPVNVNFELYGGSVMYSDRVSVSMPMTANPFLSRPVCVKILNN
ncbi:MAG: RHS repeat protein [Nitrospirae bacterium]|nr:RHS repeat protein [Nitrospirota bacterium]